ncbi:hypothetical protein ACVGV7_11410 [Enterobacter intestinihominis]
MDSDSCRSGSNRKAGWGGGGGGGGGGPGLFFFCSFNYHKPNTTTKK